MPAPTVTAKGLDEVARRIKSIAAENGVPLVENRPLARALYSDVEIGDSIPEKYYQAIAAVLAHVYGQAAGDALDDATLDSEATADSALAGA
jgi:flagellar biosynthetic protein FlhB